MAEATLTEEETALRPGQFLDAPPLEEEEGLEEFLTINTESAEDLVLKAQETEEKLTATSVPETTEVSISDISKTAERAEAQAQEIKKTAESIVKSQDFVTLVKTNEDGSSRTQKFFNPEINRQRINELLSVGFEITESQLSDPIQFGPEAPTVSSELQSSLDELEVERQKIETLRSEIDSFKITDVQLKEQTDAITTKWTNRIRQMEDINRRREKSFETLGFRIGARFTGGVRGGVFGGIIAEEERQGIIRIGELEALKQTEIQGAKDAARNQNWEVYVAKIELAENAFQNQLAVIEQLNKLEIEQRKKIEEAEKETRDQEIRASRDSTIADLFSKGIKDPVKLLDILNFDKDGKQVGDFTAEEIGDVLDILTTKEIKSQGNQIVKLDNGQTVLVNKETGEIVKDLGGWTEGNTGGNRDDLSAFEILSARDLAIKIFGKRAGAKPENYGLIEDLMVRGMTIDEIGDKLRFSGQSEAFSGAFKSAFEFVTKSGFTTSDRIASKDGLDELLEDDDTVGAREFILGLARDKASATIKQQVEGREDLLIAIDSIEVGLKALKDEGVDTGFLTGLKEKALEKGGFTVGTPEQNAIANEIAIAIINYRKAISGAAFTESESKAYDKVFPSTGKTSELNQVKINSLRKVANNAQDAFYRRSIGSSYDQIIGNEVENPEIKEDTSLSAAQPGDIVEIEGKRYRALEDGTFDLI